MDRDVVLLVAMSFLDFILVKAEEELPFVILAPRNITFLLQIFLVLLKKMGLKYV